MEDWLKSENVSAMTQLVLPGFVIAYVRARILPVRRIELKDAILGYLAISFFYQAMLVPFTSWTNSPRPTDASHAWVSIITSMVLPALLGLAFGVDAQKGWTRWLFRKAGINLSHPIDAAWDWRLGQEECWVHVKLKDGTKWAGHLGENSFSSTDPTERDLYIDDVCDTGENDANWTRRGTGLWIAHGEIQSIEFWPEHRQADDEQRDGDKQGTADSNESATSAGEAADQVGAGSRKVDAPEPTAERQEIGLTLELKGVAVVEALKRD